ncbi:polyprenyl synthetase family protein [Streptomyces sp. SID3343]|uniref:polyprenyl synthetase family protein n=1 Tax=Streptomyces sp. SID3343 TaxID=2690260 RepID=UPI0013706BF7|nr:polyprenyl synthetase family protein [Streptomyces sp. SID3343]MYW05117.1 polyprenyl synthetase family protein [Streptomyces sp. SID3343]
MAIVGPFGLSVTDETLDADIRAGMAAVEQELLAATKSEFAYLTQTSRHLVEAGGKRFRPLLVLLAAQFGDWQSPGVVPAAVVCELTHLATLYHDDVMDEALLRRGAPSANSRWDNSVAILTGDFLFARASEIVADLGADAVRIQARAFARLVTGQIRETVGPGTGDDPVEHYLSVIADKTGSLIAASGQFGAMFAGADEHVVDILTRYGERFGVAFQLADDVLDITSDSTESGKTPGTDLREGVPTLPVLHLRAGVAGKSAAEDRHLLNLLDGPIVDDDRHAEALDLLRAHPALVRAREDTRRYAEEAREVLAPLPDCSAKRALSSLCELVVERSA